MTPLVRCKCGRYSDYGLICSFCRGDESDEETVSIEDYSDVLEKEEEDEDD